MTRIGLLSDTHSYLDPKLKEFFSNVDEIWHAGDLGDIKVLDELKEWKPTRAVYGNIDDAILRRTINEHERFVCDGMDVWITHIGGYPGRYDALVRKEIYENPPKLFVAGHSHILKVIFDKKIDCLHINPGAAGLSGFHAVRTAIRFVIDQGVIKDLEIIELKGKSFYKKGTDF
jgi:putative phosphoesterase